MKNNIANFKHYNLCLPEEVIRKSKAFAAMKGIPLKDYLLQAVVEANQKEEEAQKGECVCRTTF